VTSDHPVARSRTSVKVYVFNVEGVYVCTESAEIESIGAGNIRPGMKPSSVRQILMRKSAPHPATMRTPIGGNRRVMRTMRKAGAASDPAMLKRYVGFENVK